jgi:hypothetical protein
MTVTLLRRADAGFGLRGQSRDVLLLRSRHVEGRLTDGSPQGVSGQEGMVHFHCPEKDSFRDSCEIETPTEAFFSWIGFLNEKSHILGRPIERQPRDVRCWGRADRLLARP